jgi:class 3 adenylate cyclase/tetratricopeptide (TPR) repeat protein
VLVCARCARENPDDARFCNACGAPLGAEPRAREERKIVTAVFVDLVGSTARAERLDPEDVRAVLRRYHETLRRDLERYGGTVEKFIGDAVVAVYGAPTAHEDDPERAVRAALAARESIAALNDRDDTLDLHVRVGVATGEALVTLDARAAEGESMVAGDVMNTAARIQSAAPVDGILVGAGTHRATERAIVYREHGPVEAKGKSDPVEVWEAVEAMGRVSGPGEDDPSSPLVGRENERALLLGAFARVRVERSPQLVTLVGVPGIGKSRLVVELREAAAEDEEIITWRYGRCLPYGDGVTFWALGEIVKAQAGIRENDTASLAAEKLGRAVADVVPEADRRWVEPSLRPLVGLVSEDVALADRRTELQAGWRVFLEELAGERPLVVVIDDLQWADDGLLDFVDELVDLVEGVPLLVVCCARPELLERRPGWGGGKRNALTVSLGPLTEGDVARLVESLLGRDPADADLRANVVELAAGNPLYAEELVRMRTSGGDLAGLPDTVLGIVTARVDLLPSAEKELLRDAAVMGGVVWSDGLQAVSTREPGEVDDLLRSLGRKEFLRRERQSAVAGATQHSFVHSLVRDAVYAQLPRPDRIDRHVRVARWIESLPEDRREDRAELLAHHYVEAIELSRNAGVDSTELVPAASSALREAGLHALAVAAYPAAVRALRSAASLRGGELDPHALRSLGLALFETESGGLVELEKAFDLLLEGGQRTAAAAAAADLAFAFWGHGDGAGSAAWMQRGLELIDEGGRSPHEAHVLAQGARRAMLAGDTAMAVALADRALELATAIGAERVRIAALITRATARANGAEYDTACADLEAAGELALVSDPSEATRAYVNLGSVLTDLGDLDGAKAAARRSIAVAERVGMMGGVGAFAYGNLVEAQFLAGDWEQAAASSVTELERAERLGGLYQAPMFELVLAELALVRDGRLDEAVESSRRQVAAARERNDDQAFFGVCSFCAWTFARAGLEDEAAAMLDEILERRRLRPLGVSPGFWTVACALVLDRLGRAGALLELAEPKGSRFLAAARAIDAGLFEAGAEILREIGARPFEADVRVLASRKARACGDEESAERHAERAREVLRQLGADARLAELDSGLRSRSGGS